MVSYIKSPIKMDWSRISETNSKIIFTAGTIDNGAAEPWAEAIPKFFLENPVNCNITILDPRRVSWATTETQTIDNPKFTEQVLWELDGLDSSDYIIMNLIPGSLSPISLLELGLYARTGKLLVCCPEGFYRKGNVDMVCKKYDIPLFESMNDLLNSLKNELNGSN